MRLSLLSREIITTTLPLLALAPPSITTLVWWETKNQTGVRNAGDVLYDSVLLSIDKAKRKSVEKAKEVATRDISPAAIAAKKDAQDIATLGDSVEGIARTFENLMTEIRKKSYSEQVRLLTGYKKLLKEQINVIDSHINMTKRSK
jgi:hypothetical protein